MPRTYQLEIDANIKKLNYLRDELQTQENNLVKRDLKLRELEGEKKAFLDAMSDAPHSVITQRPYYLDLTIRQIRLAKLNVASTDTEIAFLDAQIESLIHETKETQREFFDFLAQDFRKKKLRGMFGFSRQTPPPLPNPETIVEGEEDTDSE